MINVKSKKLGSWTHDKSGITVDYYISGTRFTCRVLERDYSAPEASVLKAEVMDTLEHWMTLEWFPIIEIESSGGSSSSYPDEPEGEELQLKVKRYYLSRSPAGKLMSVNWDVEEIHWKSQMRSYGKAGEMALTRLPLTAPLRVGTLYDGGNVLID